MIKHLIVYLVIISSTLSLLHVDVIKDFFNSTHLGTSVIFGCLQKKDAVNLLKNLQSLRLQYFNLDRMKNVTLARTVLFRITHHLGVVIDGDCDAANSLMQKAGREKLIGSPFHWLMLTGDYDFEPKFANVSMHIDTMFHVTVLQKESANCTVWDIYNPSTEHNGELKRLALGNWSADEGYVAYFNKSKYWFRKNMTGVRFTSVVVIPDQFNMTVPEYLANDSHKEYNSMHRFQSVTVHHCMDMYNFTMDIKKTSSWGYIVPNTGGRFDGMVGMLQRREVDFGCSPLIFKYDRIPVVDYSFGNWILKSVFIYQPPKSSVSSFEIFLRPLGRDVWICTFFMSTLIVLAIKTASISEWKFIKEMRDQIDRRWSFVIMTTVGAFCLQGGSYCPTLFGGRVLVIFLFIFYVLLYQFYAGFIVSYLLMDPPRIINNLADLLDSTLDIGIENILIDKDYFVQTRDPIALRLFHTRAKHGNNSGFYEPDDGMQLVKKGGFAFHVETCTAYPIIKKTFPSKIICALEEVQMYSTQPMHTNAQKGSPFREMLNYCMLRLVEHGLMHRLRDFWDAHRPECIDADRQLDITVGLDEFYFALVCLLMGIIFGLLFLCCEIAGYKRNEWKQKLQTIKGDRTKRDKKKTKKWYKDGEMKVFYLSDMK